ncbi:MAG: GDP-mannose 4,6-dehydratase [Candidatus Methanomethyliaceae archaeon]|nr:GDP-mannose 4,6-dehydratase [Candidatus Methanomethyliaceae archaeon]
MQILVTGGAGFIGTKLAEELVKRGNLVKIFDDLSSGRISNISHLIKTGAVEFIKGDIRDFSAIKEAGSGCDLIYHLAAQSLVPFSMERPDLDMEINIKGTLNVLMVAKELMSKVVFTSSSTVYGNAVRIPTPEDEVLIPYSFYGLSKMAAEHYCRIYSEHFNVPTVVLRLFNVYGPRNNKGLMIDLYRKLLRDQKRLELLGTGNQLKDYLYIDDAVEALMIAPDKAICKGETYNIGSGESFTVFQIAELMLEILGLKDVEIVARGGKAWLGDVELTRPDVSKAERELGWKAKVDIKEGLTKTLMWFEEKFGRIPGAKTLH